MTDKNALTYLYIRGGKQKLMLHVEAAFNKKKQNKATLSKAQKQSLEHPFNVYNLVESKIVKKPRNFLYQELIDSLQGKSIEQKFGRSGKPDEIIKIEENIQKFQILHKKFIEKQQIKSEKEIMSAKEIKSIIAIRHSLIYFSKAFQDGEIDLKLKENTEDIRILKKKIRSKQEQNKNIRFLLFNFIDKVKISIQMAELRSNYIKSHPIVKPQIQNKDKAISNKVNVLVEDYIQTFFLNLLQSIKLNELFKKSIKIFKSWDASGLLKEEADVISKKITGKLLYSVQQGTIKLKKQIKKMNALQQYHIRQKQQNFHANKNTKPLRMIQFDYQANQAKISKEVQRQKARSNNPIPQRIPSLNNGQFQTSQFEFEKPKSKTQFVRKQQYDRNAHQNARFQKKSQYNYQKYYVSNMSELKLLTNKLPRVISHFSQGEKLKKYSPLRVSSQDKSAYNRNSQNSNRINLAKPSITTTTTYTNLKLFKYPIKIESFEIFSPQSSNLCYNIQQYSLKELPLKFIKDRIRFKENRVKIQYCYNFSAEQQTKVSKSLQILSCLGAEVTCQVQSSYKFWNQIDEIQIMSVSWLLQMPVRDVLQCYANFFCANQTKK